MSLRRLAVENYRCFRDRQELEIFPVTVILGKNNSGKSALVRAPLIFATRAAGEQAARRGTGHRSCGTRRGEFPSYGDGSPTDRAAASEAPAVVLGHLVGNHVRRCQLDDAPARSHGIPGTAMDRLFEGDGAGFVRDRTAFLEQRLQRFANDLGIKLEAELIGESDDDTE